MALARALIADPPFLLFDEPLGALDRNLREQMQIEMKSLHKEVDITTVCVTHDQEEPLTLSDPHRRHARGPDRADRQPGGPVRPAGNMLRGKILGGGQHPRNPNFKIESDAVQPPGTVAIIRPERISIVAPDERKRGVQTSARP